MNLNPFWEFLLNLLGLYSWGLIIYIIFGWLVAFQIVNRSNPFVFKIYLAFTKLYEPVLGKIRSILPDLGVLDLSPIIIFLLIQLLQSIIINYFYVF